MRENHREPEVPGKEWRARSNPLFFHKWARVVFVLEIVIVVCVLLLSSLLSFSSRFWLSRFDLVVPCLLVSHLQSRHRHRTLWFCVQYILEEFVCRAERRVLWVSWGVWDWFSESCAPQIIFFRGHLVFRVFRRLCFGYLCHFPFAWRHPDTEAWQALGRYWTHSFWAWSGQNCWSFRGASQSSTHPRTWWQHLLRSPSLPSLRPEVPKYSLVKIGGILCTMPRFRRKMMVFATTQSTTLSKLRDICVQGMRDLCLWSHDHESANHQVFLDDPSLIDPRHAHFMFLTDTGPMLWRNNVLLFGGKGAL